MPAAAKFVVVGGSGASTPELADAISAWPGGRQRRPPLEVWLHGRSQEKLAVVGRAFEGRLRIGDVDDTRVHSSTNLEATLDGAAFVLMQARVGGLDARAFDETFPRRHGLPGEETMGPGGFANALRTVPALRPLWAAIARLAPGAAVIDLTNPAGIVLAAAVREFGIDAVEVCDSPIALIEAVAARLQRPRSEVASRYVGANHLGWWVPDRTGDLESVADLASGFTAEEVASQGALPGPYVRYVLAPERVLEAQQGARTRAEQLMDLERAMLASYAESVDADRSSSPRRGAVWYAKAVLPYVDAVIHGSTDPMVVGRVVDERPYGIPPGVVLERAVTITAGRGPALNVPAPPLPSLPSEVLRGHLEYESLTIEALATGASRQALERALAANPMVPSLDRAAGLVDEILTRGPR